MLRSVCLAGLLVTGLGLRLAHAQTTAPVAGAPAGCFGVTDGPEKNPSVTGKRTKRWRKTTRGKIEGRAGSLNGARVGWARVLGSHPAHAIVLKVDLNGGKTPDVSCGPSGLFDGTSYLYEASSSPNRAFKACVKLGSNVTGPCHPSYQTGWW
jgi:hypothetical protein